MHIREVIDICSHLRDNYNDEGVHYLQWNRFLNTSQVLVMKDYARNRFLRREPRDNPPYGFENTQFDTHLFAGLLQEIPDTGNIIPDSDGKVTYATIRSYFPNDTIRDENGDIETRKPDIFHIANMARWDGSDTWEPVTWARHNEIEAYHRNPFRRAENRWPLCVLYDDYLKIWPNAENRVRMTVIRMPKHMWYNPNDETENIDPELWDSAMYDVIVKAVGLATANAREGELYQMVERIKKEK